MTTKKKIIIARIIIVSISTIIILGLAFLIFRYFRNPDPLAASAFLPGVYICEPGNEFCRIKDTLILHRMSLGGDRYTISRKSAFVRVRQGKTGPPEYQQDQWDGVYDPTRRILTAAGRTDTILYSSDRNKIYKNDFIYEKIE